MGIRVTCPNGHELNVKDYLAGKRGICPHCQARFEIPLGNPSPAVASAPAAKPRPAAREVVQRAAESPASPVVTTPASATPPAPPAVTPRAAVAAPAAADEVVWYVRPAGGGQYGPADQTMMQQWIAEGRVPPDALVWRTGWTDWQPASAATEQLPATMPSAGVKIEPIVDTLAASVSVASEAAPQNPAASAAARLQRRRRAAARLQAWAAGLLLIVAVVLGIVLVNVLQRGGDDGDATTPPPDAPASES